MSKDENQPFFYFRGTRTEARVEEAGTYAHWFGNTNSFSIKNPPKTGAVHQLLDLDLRDPALGLAECGLARLPLYYGFQFEGDDALEYIFGEQGEIEILILNEASYCASWPYAGYPKSFPKKPFTLTKPVATTLDQFEQNVRQGIDPREADKFIAVVPPSSLYGVHLWEEDSDYDHIHVKFFFNPNRRHVRVYNECD